MSCICFHSLFLSWQFGVAFIGFLSRLSTYLVETIPPLQDELWAHLHQLGGESHLRLICGSEEAPNKSSTSSLMGWKEKWIFWETNTFMRLCPLPRLWGLSRALQRWAPCFSSALTWQHFALLKFLFPRGFPLAQVPRNQHFLPIWTPALEP